MTERRIPGTAIKDDVNEILHRLDLLEGDKLKNAAVVLFAKQDKMKLVQCMIKMARFKGTNKLGKFIDNQRFFGNAFDMLTTAEHFLIRHLPISSHFIEGQFKRVDKSALPVFAVREALINALCHREYRERSGCIELAIYDDRLEIWSRGLLPDGLNIDSLKSTHKSDPRNELISNVFYVRGLIEAWGTGTNRMIENCQDEGVPEPVFEEDSGGFSVIFKFNTPMGGELDVGGEGPDLSVRQQEILGLLEGGENMSANEIYNKLDRQPSLRALKADLTALKKLELIEQVGKGPSTLWKLST